MLDSYRWHCCYTHKRKFQVILIHRNIITMNAIIFNKIVENSYDIIVTMISIAIHEDT